MPATAVAVARKCASPHGRPMVRKLLFPRPVMSSQTRSSDREIRHYFEYSSSGVEVVADGLTEIRFGEFLVEQKILDRAQLFRAMQMQDRNPGVRLGECAAALGYAPIHEIERAYRQFAGLSCVLIA